MGKIAIRYMPRFPFVLVSERLTALSENEPTLTAGINELKESISSIQSLQHPGPSITPTPSLFPCPAQTTCPPITPVPEQSIPHSQIHVSDNMSDFITIEEANTLTTFLIKTFSHILYSQDNTWKTVA